MRQSDLEYYRRRAAQERRIAIDSFDGAVARVHSQLADAYDGMVLAAAPGTKTQGCVASSALGSRT